MKTTPNRLLLKPPSIQQKPGLKQSRKRKLPETTPANQKKINSLFKPTQKLPNNTIVSNPHTAGSSRVIARNKVHAGQSQSSLVTCQNPCQKPDSTELAINDFINQDQNTCPDLGEN